jgi:hypothetical protein
MSSTRPAADLLATARRTLVEASLATTPGERYAAAHLAALRGAAALLAARSRPGRRSRVRSVWVVLPQIAPEFTEWAEFFAATALKRSAAEAGLPCVLAREADDLVREADSFVARIAHALDLPYQPALVGTLVG